MQATAERELASEAAAKGAAPSPVRILVQTQTHLVPGDGWLGKMGAMKRAVARHVLNADFDKKKDNMIVYNDLFAVPGERCFFLYDHASSPVGDDVADHDIPLLWYRWTGEQLIALNQAPPKEIRRRLKADYPFMIRTHPQTPQWEQKVSKQELQKQRQEESPEARTKRRREQAQDKLRCLRPLAYYEHGWLGDNPEQEAWLKENLEPAAWSWYERLKAEEQNAPPAEWVGPKVSWE